MTHIDMDDDEDRLMVDAESYRDESLRLECLRMAIDLAPDCGEVITIAGSFVAFVKGHMN